MANPRFGPNPKWPPESNIEIDITLDLSKMETQMKCPFLLIIGFQIT